MTPVTQERATTGRVVLHNVSWATYEALVAEIENAGTRLTYDEGELEIMTPSGPHERYKARFGRLIGTLTEELGIAIASGGSVTLKRALAKRGLEPDECYWVENEARVRQIGDLDLTKDPPPDLAIEVEVSTSALDRMGIYASLGVREIWRFTRDGQLVCHIRANDGRYVEAPKSGRFPFLAPSELVPFVTDASGTDETTWIRGFRKWVRAELAPRFGSAPPA